MIKQYRKKPVVIEAVRVPVYDEYESTVQYVDDCIALATWCRGTSHMMRDEDNHIAIATLEGVMKASPGDYIIRGVQGEFYPCKPDIFADTYEEA